MTENADHQNQVVIRPATSVIKLSNRLDHFLARWGFNRMGHRVEPGLYALGNPDSESPVLVTANYTLSFDALRSALSGFDAYILVLDTKGVNVWCAAGGKEFSTSELIKRMEAVCLRSVVKHRRLILPQLGASGVSARQVIRETGFSVEFGPVRSKDLPLYLKTGTATPGMRQVLFPIWDRVVLIPVELVHALPYFLVACVVLFILGGVFPAAAAAAVLFSGVVLFPVLLPYLPTKEFSSKGFILGALTVIPFVILPLSAGGQLNWLLKTGLAITAFFSMPPATAFLALNFTGSTPVTSRSGVKKEFRTYLPVMAWMFGSGLGLGVILITIRALGMI